ncbi:MAG: type II toxin-antitoxin system VapC family toxin [Nocardioidaceae bacterium]
MSVVVDASVIVALVVADDRQEAAQAHLEAWAESGEELHAPAVLPYEVANVLARLVFDGAFEADGIAETWSDLAALGVVLHPFDFIHDGPAVDTTSPASPLTDRRSEALSPVDGLHVPDGRQAPQISCWTSTVSSE